MDGFTSDTGLWLSDRVAFVTASGSWIWCLYLFDYGRDWAGGGRSNVRVRGSALRYRVTWPTAEIVDCEIVDFTGGEDLLDGWNRAR